MDTKAKKVFLVVLLLVLAPLLYRTLSDYYARKLQEDFHFVPAVKGQAGPTVILPKRHYNFPGNTSA